MLRFTVFIVVFCVGYGHAQVQPVNFTEIEALQNNEKRLVMVLIETDWCKYCQAMKHIIRGDERISQLLKKHFYTIFFNAENKESITFAGKLFSYKPTGINTGVHQLAEQLGSINGQLSFPSLCFLNSKNEIVYQYNGFLDKTTLLQLLNTLILDKSVI